jgi:hypothetical protein
MIRAVANRPVENLITDVVAPDWQVDPTDNEIWGEIAPPESLVDEDGNPLQPEEPGVPADEQPGDVADRPRDDKPDEEQLDRQWLDRALTRRPPAPPRDPPPQRERERQVKPEE